MNRFKSSAACLAGSLGVVLAFAAPAVKAEPTAAQLHAQVTEWARAAPQSERSQVMKIAPMIFESSKLEIPFSGVNQ